jgi:hypothetical protein
MGKTYMSHHGINADVMSSGKSRENPRSALGLIALRK